MSTMKQAPCRNYRTLSYSEIDEIIRNLEDENKKLKERLKSLPDSKGRYGNMYATDKGSDLYKVYRIRPNSTRYDGFSLVAAESVEEANKYIEDFKKADFNNYQNSLGYSNVDDTDLENAIVSTRKGIVFEGIDYLG